MKNSIVDIPGLKVGHAQNTDAITGCTVILAEEGAVAGVDQRGGAPGTRETDLLNPVNSVEKVFAILLSGGSAFGLDAASGVVKYLEEKNIGYPVGPFRVPIVPSAVLFDLFIGDGSIRPDLEMGYQACINVSNSSRSQGSIGAGTGATLGKLKGMEYAVKGGIGTACIEIVPGIFVGALIAVNPFGDVINPQTGQIFAGVRNRKNFPAKSDDLLFANSLKVMKLNAQHSYSQTTPSSNTVIGVVATNAKLTKSQATKIAQMAQNGVVRTIRPANTLYDGDTIFCLSTGTQKLDVNLIGAYAAQMVEQSILNAVTYATSLGGIPSFSDLTKLN